MNPITSEQLAQIASECEDRDLNSVWLYFDTPGGDPGFPHSLMSFAERREGFLWTVKQLFEHGFIELNRDGGAPFPGLIDEKLDALRAAFPLNDEGMEDGMWFFFPECPMGSSWWWPKQAPPVAFVPGKPLGGRDPVGVRSLAPIPAGGPVDQALSDDVLTAEQLEYMALTAENRSLRTIWSFFIKPGGYPEVAHHCHSFDDRKHGFVWTTRRLVEHGYMQLFWRNPEEKEAALEEYLQAIQTVFPSDDYGFNCNAFFGRSEYPVDVRWEWEGRSPTPFLAE